MSKPATSSPIVAAGAVIIREQRDVLLVRRGRPPRQNEWSIPGGKIEWGETVEAGLRREIREETSLEVELVGLIEVVDSVIRDDDGHVMHHHVLVDFLATPLSGVATAGDDVLETQWVPLDALGPFGMWQETRRIIAKAADMLRR